MEPPLSALKKIHTFFIDSNQSLGVAESCTGGLLSFWLTHQAGSSKYFKGGLVAYSTEVKIAHLALNPEQTAKKGLVTKDFAESMAQGVKNFLQVDWALSITGIAGPTWGTLGEPVGKVAFCVCFPDGKKSAVKYWPGLNRQDIRRQSALFALDFLIFGF